MADHTHEFQQMTSANGTPILFPCRICKEAPATIIATLVTERDARLGQVYDLLEAIGAILHRQRPRTTKPARTRRLRRPRR